MNKVLKEMLDYFSMDTDALAHYGTPRHSGRYPWGSGENPYQRTKDLLGRIEELKKQGWSETPENIEKEFGLTVRQYRAQKSLANDLRRLDKVVQAESLKSDGLNNSEIGRKMGINESTVRSLLDSGREAKMMQAMNTANFIREQVDKKGPIDVGSNVNVELGISREKMDVALSILESEGYVLIGGRVPQVTNPKQMTTLKLICPPGTPKKAAYDYENISSLTEYVSHDQGETFDKFVYPKSMDSNRIMVRYKEEGGIDRDGLIEIRRGVEDLSLGNSHYSQVRILVDNKKYMKGMAIYSDNMPDGVDIIFNTNKSKSVDKMDVFKDIKNDPENPFGSSIKAGGQSYYIDKNGKKQLSLINKRADEGDWSEWKDTVPSQFLSKQTVQLAKKQLGMAIADKRAEYDDICELTNPTIKKHLLNKFADECDSAAVHLKAAALPGQKYRVIIPINTLKDNEVYAPTYENGSQIALIRYPHGGLFEIPILTVNNRNPDAKKMLPKDIEDAVAINKNVADRLSGADFDGDTVMCIPVRSATGKTITDIKNKNPLEGLKDFDTKMAYGSDRVEVDADGKKHYYRNGREYPIMQNTQNEMGRISNLITDMTLKGASDDELAAAVRHSMVVIDAEKHKLDYKQSEIDNHIATLKKNYQQGGASTLISRSSGPKDVIKRQGTPNINTKGKPWYDPNRPEGALIYKTAEDAEYIVASPRVKSKSPPNSTIRISDRGKRYIQFDGEDNWIPIDGKTELNNGSRVYSVKKTKVRTQKSTRMAETDDAYTLISDADTPMERVYADYANRMKSMANQARKQLMITGKIQYSAEAKQKYKDEVDSLKNKLLISSANSPKERLANIKANAEVAAKKRANPGMTSEEIKKASQQAIEKYRNELGAVKRRDRFIEITDKEWEAIQAGAISENQLIKILNNTDIGDLRQRATPKTNGSLSAAKINRINSMKQSGYNASEIARALGVSLSTVSKYLKGSES